MAQQIYFWVYIQRKQNLISKKYLYYHVHHSIIHNCQNTETTQMSSADAQIN